MMNKTSEKGRCFLWDEMRNVISQEEKGTGQRVRKETFNKKGPREVAVPAPCEKRKGEGKQY